MVMITNICVQFICVSSGNVIKKEIQTKLTEESFNEFLRKPYFHQKYSEKKDFKRSKTFS